MKYCRRIVACMICCLMVCALLVPGSRAAAASLDQSAVCELTIDFQANGGPVSGADFQIYRVGEMDRQGSVSLSGQFTEYPVDINTMTDSGYQEAADTLWGYVQRDALQPDHVVTTDEDGIAQASGLRVGIYLVVCEPVEVEGGKLISSAQLLRVPFKSNTADDWDYSLEVTPKVEFVENPPEPVTVKVLKQWDDSGNEKARPVSITVHLLCDGEIFDSVILTAADNWRCTWEELDPDCEWTVVEDPVDGYTVSVRMEGITFVVKNTYVEPPTEPETTPPTEPPKIPQTGMTWWPVPVLLLAGFALIAVGVVSRRKTGNEA